MPGAQRIPPDQKPRNTPRPLPQAGLAADLKHAYQRLAGRSLEGFVHKNFALAFVQPFQSGQQSFGGHLFHVGAGGLREE